MLEEIVFKNKFELARCLQEYLEDVNDMDEMSVFAHQVNDYRDEFGDGNPHEKLMSILHGGLDAARYGSIYGTLNFMGSSRDALTVERATQYNYHYSDTRAGFFPIVLLAFPRFVNIDGKKEEYATSKYTPKEPHAHQMLVRLLEAKYPYALPPLLQHTPKCWADILKGFSKFGTADTLCAFYKDVDGNYHIMFPHTHWAEQNKETYQSHKQKLSKRIKDYNLNLDEAIITTISHQNEVVWSMYDNFD